MIPFMLEVLKHTKLIRGRKKSRICFWGVEDEGKGHDGTYWGEDNGFDLKGVLFIEFCTSVQKQKYTFHFID